MVDIARYEELRRLPHGTPVMYQNWQSLLFLHFPCDPKEIQALLPDGLEVDLFQGQAWVGLVPFKMANVRPRGLPSIGPISNFPETNVRTYVHYRGQPGVWFFSLDAASLVGCKIGNSRFGLPYHHARMGIAVDEERITYESMRMDLRTGCTATCKVGLALPNSEPGSLEYFLVERYQLFSRRQGRLMKGRVYHTPYPLYLAQLEGIEETLIKSVGIQPKDFEHVAFSPGVQVKIFGIEPVD